MYNEFDPDWHADKKALWELLTCPIDWDVACPNDEFRYWLRFLWFSELSKYEIDCEVSSLLDRFLIEPSEISFSDLSDEDALLNKTRVLTYHSLAVKTYKVNVRRFRDLRAAGPKDYPKHYCSPAASDEEVASQSTRGEGVLYPRSSLRIQTMIAWHVLDNELRSATAGMHPFDLFESPDGTVAILEETLGGHHLIVHAKLAKNIGCAHGNPTSFVCVDFNFSTPLVHLYPESEEEYQAGQRKTYASSGDWAAWDIEWPGGS
jgi:hypothetical protein